MSLASAGVIEPLIDVTGAIETGAIEIETVKPDRGAGSSGARSCVGRERQVEYERRTAAGPVALGAQTSA